VTVKPQTPHAQLNLPLLNLTPVKLPSGDQQELVLALVDLLVRVAEADKGVMPKGGGNESQTHD
jgi:hypothetical protein